MILLKITHWNSMKQTEGKEPQKTQVIDIDTEAHEILRNPIKAPNWKPKDITEEPMCRVISSLCLCEFICTLWTTLI